MECVSVVDWVWLFDKNFSFINGTQYIGIQDGIIVIIFL